MKDISVFLSSVEDGDGVWREVSANEEGGEDIGEYVCGLVGVKVDGPDDGHVETGVVVG